MHGQHNLGCARLVAHTRRRLTEKVGDLRRSGKFSRGNERAAKAATGEGGAAAWQEPVRVKMVRRACTLAGLPEAEGGPPPLLGALKGNAHTQWHCAGSHAGGGEQPIACGPGAHNSCIRCMLAPLANAMPCTSAPRRACIASGSIRARSCGDASMHACR